MNIEERLSELNIVLPEWENNDLPFAEGVAVDKLVYLSGQIPLVKGEVVYKGLVGKDITLEQAKEAAKICTLNSLAALKNLIGNLNKVNRIIKVNGYVASDPDFYEQHLVINAVSNLLNDIFGDRHKHARVALGHSTLPMGASVEIEMIVEVNT